MRISAYLSAVAALFVGVASADDKPTLQVSRTVPMVATSAGSLKCDPGRFVPLNLESGKPALVEASDVDAVKVFEVKPGGTLIGVRHDEPSGAEPKEYSFPDAKGKVYVALARNKASVVTVRAFVNGEGDGPPRVAGVVVIEVGGARPPPVPGPTPAPSDKVAAFVIVEETADAANDRAAFLSDSRLARTIKDQSLKYQVFDKDAAKEPQFPAGLKGYAERAAGKKLPRVFLTDAAGKLLHEGDLPANAADLAKLLQQYKGS